MLAERGEDAGLQAESAPVQSCTADEAAENVSPELVRWHDTVCDEERGRAKKMGIADETRIYRTEDLASGNDIRFVATGVTDGDLLKGVHFFARGARTHSMLLDRLMGKLRFIDTTHFEDIDHPPLIRLE